MSYKPSKHIKDMRDFATLLQEEGCPLSDTGTKLASCLFDSVLRAGLSENELTRTNVRDESSVNTWVFAPFYDEGIQNKAFGKLRFKTTVYGEFSDSAQVFENDFNILTSITSKMKTLFQNDVFFMRDFSISSDSWQQKQMVLDAFAGCMLSLKFNLMEQTQSARGKTSGGK